MKKFRPLFRIFRSCLLALPASVLFCLSLPQSQSVNYFPISPQISTEAGSTLTRTIPGTPEAETNSLHVNVDVVLVPVTVSDRNNRPVTTLNRQDFALFEEDKRQNIRYFSTEEAPLSIAILFDVSKSMTDKIDSERAALVEFFNNANPADEYFGITFSKRPRLLGDASQSIDELQHKLLATETGGPTAMLDAVYLAESKLRSARYERKAIVIFSDGGDNASRYTLHEIKNLVQESDVQVYAIGLFDTFFVGTLEEKLGKKWLGEITDASGGRTITVDNRIKLPEAAAEISREIRSQYVLGYHPEAGKGSKWRKIKVNVTDPVTKQRLHAFYRKGYLTAGRSYAPTGTQSEKQKGDPTVSFSAHEIAGLSK